MNNVAQTWRSRVALLAAIWASVIAAPLTSGAEAGESILVSASGSAAGAAPAGAIDGDRFSTQLAALWKADAASGSLQFTFAEPRRIGAILQINGDHPELLQHAPRNYTWQVSDDADTWRPLLETVVRSETRMYRIHRLSEAVTTRHIRLMINLSHGDAPAVREVEFYDDVHADIPFGEWILGVSSLEDPNSASVPMRFVDLARECAGWEQVAAQCIWHGDLSEEFVATEPRPLCAFLSGSFQEWCQCSREPWRGVEAVLKSRRLPMWGACGGAQVLAILEDTGVDQPWDCPRCRDPKNPKSPIYSHIGHTGPAPCGDYTRNIGERGEYQMRIVADDPAFEGLPETFEIYESHIGQIDYVPTGWTRVVTKGAGAHTVNQCLRVSDAPIYSAQFHMETYANTRAASITIMTNFLKQAQAWGGYNPEAAPLPPPQPLAQSETPAEPQP
jgi:hypothetical protein